jgi:hypothetical protein
VTDGNMKADHLIMRTDRDVKLTDGEGYMVRDDPYQAHLKTAQETRSKQVGKTAKFTRFAGTHY